MSNKVTVTADKNKNIITVSPNNPEFGWLTLEQEVFEINDRGWLKSTKRTALVHGKVDDLKKAGYKEGTELPGKIVVLESLTPFNLENPDRDLKVAGKSGVICRVEDEPIYRKSFYTGNQNISDEFVAHTNVEEIRQVMEAQKMLNLIHKETEELEPEL
jgi:hypothetical protein